MRRYSFLGLALLLVLPAMGRTRLDESNTRDTAVRRAQSGFVDAEVKSGRYTEDDRQAWIDAWSQPGSTTAGLNYYRANARPESFLRTGAELPPVQSPTMGVWSSGDIALTEAQMTSSANSVAGPWRYERLDGPGHWMQLEKPGEVNRLLLDFLPA